MIGFGEAAQAFAADARAMITAYDRKSDGVVTRAAKQAEADALGVTLANDHAAATRDAAIVLSLVTADQALPAARTSAATIPNSTLYCDMNSVAPDTKRAAAAAINAAGGRYVDVAVMAPVHPARLRVPLLVSGDHAEEAATALRAFGFATVRVVDGGIGAASAIKMIRSVMVKGMEALTTECVLAADRAGVLDAVIASLDASWPGADWRARADYNLDRMMIHGLRRAAEMEEVVATLDALGTGSAMTRGTVLRQRAIGGLGLAPPDGLTAKIAAIDGDEDRNEDKAA
jgi:3-hydroxyisobutyrate dehydrogenase-like beta-hydroxyacid dehydrogenase